MAGVRLTLDVEDVVDIVLMWLKVIVRLAGLVEVRELDAIVGKIKKLIEYVLFRVN
jgi:hypothetical protein